VIDAGKLDLKHHLNENDQSPVQVQRRRPCRQCSSCAALLAGQCASALAPRRAGWQQCCRCSVEAAGQVDLASSGAGRYAHQDRWTAAACPCIAKLQCLLDNCQTFNPSSYLMRLKHFRTVIAATTLLVSQFAAAAVVVDTGPGPTAPSSSPHTNWSLYEKQSMPAASADPSRLGSYGWYIDERFLPI
jgi:hypothetical protein